MLNAQVETFEKEFHYETTIDIFLINGLRISLATVASDCSLKVLKKALNTIDLPENLHKYFCLYLIREENGKMRIVKKLMEFMESPYITQKHNYKDCKIVVRTNYWDRQWDDEIMENEVGLNLLMIETSVDLENNWITAPESVKNQLSVFQTKGMKREFVTCCRTLSYGIQFPNILTDYVDDSQRDSVVIICNSELVIRCNLGGKVHETRFKITRMRCWRVSTLLSDDAGKKSNSNSKTFLYELSFEYLMAKNVLKWIKLVSSSYETICLISLSLQVRKI